MVRNLLIGALVAGCVIGASALYVTLGVARHARAAGAVLAGPVSGLDPDEIRLAAAELDKAEGILRSAPARALGLLPVARQNMQMAEAAVAGLGKVVREGVRLGGALDRMLAGGLLREGEVDIDSVRLVGEMLDRQVERLKTLEREVGDRRTGWLLPVVWERTGELLEEASALRESAEAAAGVLEVAPALLGDHGARRYAVMLVNNAELRGAGGILSGIGELEVEDGRLELGAFHYYADLSDGPPFRGVRASPDFIERFGRYRAETTLWINVSASPDVNEVARVAGRLYRVSTGRTVDGALMVDPRGLAALMREDDPVEVPGRDEALTSHEVPEFVYSRAYEEFRGSEARRRQALVGVGEAAFRSVLEAGAGDRDDVERAALAVAGGHIRFVPFDPAEEGAVSAAGVAGPPMHADGDRVLVVTQNLGMDKLDYWAEREVRHSCAIRPAFARCETEVLLANSVPPGLPRYVTQPHKPYGRMRSDLELYVPASATLRAVDRDGEPVEFRPQAYEGHTAVTVPIVLDPSEATSLRVAYELPLDGNRYELDMIPQPLARDAHVEVELRVPRGWSLQGGADGAAAYSGPFDRTLRFRASAAEDPSGIPGLWQALVGFWRRPIL